MLKGLIILFFGNYIFSFSLPLKNAAEALANINAVSEGIATDELKNFVQVNLPKKAKKAVVGVLDPKLGGVLSEELGCKVTDEHCDYVL